VRIATAGHLPPILAAPGDAPFLLPLTPEPLLGAGFGGSRTSTEFTFPPGALMAMYTDGLVERRGESLDAGLERLRTIVSPETPRALIGTIMRNLIGDASPADDVALVLVRRATD
jgi:serine phosphatase RsbU (regulator of sigma subunit)